MATDTHRQRRGVEGLVGLREHSLVVLDNNSEPKSYIYCARVRKSYGPVAWIIASRVGPRVKNQRKKNWSQRFRHVLSHHWALTGRG